MQRLTKKELKKFRKKQRFENKIAKLQIELTKLQEHIKDKQKKFLFIFEGRDASGKGSMIKTITQCLNPRFAKVVALGIPSSIEKKQWYFQRYIAHLPNGGDMVFFDRSWYNRAMVEPVMGFCTDKENKQFLQDVDIFESLLQTNNIKIFKFYFSITKQTQQKRFKDRQNNIVKNYKLSSVDLKAQNKWNEFTKAKEQMFLYSNTKNNPWKTIVTDNKKLAKINCIKYILSQIDYKEKDKSIVDNIDTNIVKNVF